MNKVFYTVSEIQDFLKIGQNQAYRLIKSGEIPSIKIGNHYRVPHNEFFEWKTKKISESRKDIS